MENVRLLTTVYLVTDGRPVGEYFCPVARTHGRTTGIHNLSGFMSENEGKLHERNCRNWRKDELYFFSWYFVSLHCRSDRYVVAASDAKSLCRRSRKTSTDGLSARSRNYYGIHAKNQFIHCVNGVGSKTAKIIKNVILPTVTSPDVNVMLSNITFLMIFAVFDPTPLTQWINCSF